MKNKYNQSAFASAARIATPANVEIDDKYAGGVQIIINVTAVTATPSVVPTIDGFDPLSGVFYNILTAAAITGTGTTVLRIHPELAAVANLTAKDFLPERYRIVMTHADADSITYSVGVNSIV